MPRSFEPPETDAPVIDAWARATERMPTQPNGAFVDIMTRMPVADAKAIKAPILLIYGALDRATPVSQPNMPVFFGQIAAAEKQLTIVPGAGHMIPVQKARGRYYREVASWLGAE